MDIETNRTRKLLDAVQGRRVPGNQPFGLAVMALASVLGTDEPIEDASGVSWLDEHGRFNSLLVAGKKLVHALVPSDGAPRATVHVSPVGAVQAADIRETNGFSGLAWFVDTWHVTLADGTVITLRSGGDGSRAEAISDFVRQQLLP